MSDKTDKKPIFQKVWFWVAIVVVVFGVLAVVGAKDDGPQKVGDSSSVSNDNSAQTSSPDANTNAPFAVGDVVSIDNQEISVVSVERNYSTGNSYITPDEGKEYVKVNLQIQNKSDDTKSFNAFNWQMENGDGVIAGYTDAMLAQAKDGLGSGDLAAGGTKKGSIVFEVPEGDTALKVHFKPSLFSDKEVVINLQ